MAEREREGGMVGGMEEEKEEGGGGVSQVNSSNEKTRGDRMN